MCLSIIEGATDGDACFPKFDASTWTMARRGQRPGDLFLADRRADPGGSWMAAPTSTLHDVVEQGFRGANQALSRSGSSLLGAGRLAIGVDMRSP